MQSLMLSDVGAVVIARGDSIAVAFINSQNVLCPYSPPGVVRVISYVAYSNYHNEYCERS